MKSVKEALLASFPDGHPPLLVDGGIRRGSDVIKCIALGADAVLLGRPLLYALAAGGESGVARALQIFVAELESSMKLSGCASVQDIGEELLAV